MKKLIALALAALMILACVSALAEPEVTLTLVTNAAFPPYEYYDEDDVPVGIDIEIGKLICDKLGYGMEVEDIDFGAIINEVTSSETKFGAAGMTVTEERKQSVDFTDTYAIGVQVVIVPEDCEAEDIYALIEANGGHIKIAVQQDTTGDIYTSDKFEAAGSADIERYKTGADAVLALTSGKVDCVVIDNEPAKNFVAVNEGLKILDSAYTEEEYAMAFGKNNPYYEAFNEALKELQADGSLQAIIDKYIPAEAE